MNYSPVMWLGILIDTLRNPIQIIVDLQFRFAFYYGKLIARIRAKM